MKVLKVLLISVVILGAIGYGAYSFGTKVVSEKVIESVSNELENNGSLENIKSEIENDPELKSFIEEGTENIESSTLPFTTKEQATKVLVSKVGVSKINDMKTKLQDGSMSMEEALQEVEGSLSEEEVLALKVIAYKELYKE